MSLELKISESFAKLKHYCEKENFKGWDPYDGLNSRFFNSLPIIRNNRLFRLAWIQLFKRNPINLRKFFLVKKEHNAKGLGLFLTGYCNLYKLEKKKEYLDQIKFLSKKLISMKAEGYSGACWGYHFPWQSRAFYQPRNSPTVVASVFIGNALLDAYDILQDEEIFETAYSISNFIIKDLNRTYEGENFAFSYSPLDTSQVLNASLLGSNLLARLHAYKANDEFVELAKKSIDFCNKYQNKDGSWPYGRYHFHTWIDNFHTGYNLECINAYQEYSKDHSYAQSVKKGLQYYLKTFFTAKGESKYYNNSLYPIDIHAPAQLIVTLSRLGVIEEEKDLVNRVLNWTIDNMQTSKGYFRYQVTKHYKKNIPYMRWAQAWMFYAFTFYLLHFEKK